MQVGEHAAASGKEREILDVAAGYFLSHGYDGTSVSSLSREAGISKESIYRYFSSKEALFEAVISRELAEYERRLKFVESEVESLGLERALSNAGTIILAAVCSDRTLALRRLVFQQVESNPEIGHYYYEVGPQRAYRYLQKLFDMHRARTGSDTKRLAHHYVGMLLHHTMLERQCGMIQPLRSAQIRRIVAEVTNDFLNAFFD